MPVGRAAKNETLDSCKLLACFFVVTIHVRFPGELGQLCVHLGRFAVPFFFMVSGYFTQATDAGTLVATAKKRARKHLISFLACFLIYLAFHLIDIGRTDGIDDWVRDAVSPFNVFALVVLSWTTPYVGVGHLWFLLALTYVYVLYAIVSQHSLLKAAERFSAVSIVLVVAVEAARYYLPGFDLMSIWYRNAFFLGFPCFMLGNHLGRSRCPEPSERRGQKPLTRSGLGMLLVGLGLFLAEVGLRLDGFDLYPSSLALAYSSFLFALDHPGARSSVLSMLGRGYSAKVYAWHYLLFMFLKRFVMMDISVGLMPLVVFFGTLLWQVTLTYAV